MDNIDKIKYLLQKISLIHDRTLIRKSQEESFNVFTTLMQWNDEVCLHSRFISSILDPKSPHKFKDLFLEKFLETINSSFTYDLETLEVIPSTETWTEYKEIDILLIDRHRLNAVIIENKINAYDSNHEKEGQLECYYRRIIEEDGIPADKVEVYYLKLHKDMLPSEASVSTSKKYPELPDKVKCISYEVEIKEWLNLCIKEAVNSPYLRETLNQYLKLVKIMTNDTDMQEQLDIMDLLSSSEDALKSARLLFDNYYNLHQHTISAFFEDLCVELEHRGYEITERVSDETISNMVFGNSKQRKNSDANIYFKNHKGYVFTLGADVDDNLCFGVGKQYNKGQIQNLRNLITENKDKVENLELCGGWIFMKDFTSIPDEDFIYLWDFTNKAMFNMIRKEYRDNLIKKYLDSFEEDCKKLKLK